MRARGLLKSKFALAGGILLSVGALSHFLNTTACRTLQRNLPFEVKGHVGLTWPGFLKVSGFAFAKPHAFQGSAKTLEIRYRPWYYLKTASIRMTLSAQDLSVSLEGLSSAGHVFEMGFESFRASGEVHPGGTLSLDYFFSGNQEILIYSSGSLDKKRLDLVFSCFLKEASLKRLPEFLVEHLFVREDSPLRQLKFRAGGTWDRPHFSLSSDLVNLEVRSRTPA